MSNNIAYETWPIGNINPVPWNPRIALTPDDPEWKQIEQSVQNFGLVVPLVVNRSTGNLISGHQRLAVLKHNGHTEAAVTVIDIDADEEPQLNMAMNSVHGRWDDELLAGILDYLTDAGLVHLTGFNAQELAHLTGQLAATVVDNDTPIIAATGNNEFEPSDIAMPTVQDDNEILCVQCPNCGTEQPA